MGQIPGLRAIIEREAAEAEADPLELPGFRALRLNMGVEDQARALLTPVDDWMACETDDPPDPVGPYVLGVDLSDGAAMCGLAAYWPECGLLAALAAFPEIPSLRERGRIDQCGSLYVDIHRRGELMVTPGRAVDVPALLLAALEAWGRPRWVVADRYRRRDLLASLEDAGFPLAVLIERGQGYKDGAADVRGWRRALLERRVKVAPSLLLRSAMMEAVVIANPSGDVKLAKSTEGGRRHRAKDDAAAAAVLAVAHGIRQPARIQRSWRYRGAV